MTNQPQNPNHLQLLLALVTDIFSIVPGMSRPLMRLNVMFLPDVDTLGLVTDLPLQCHWTTVIEYHHEANDAKGPCVIFAQN